MCSNGELIVHNHSINDDKNDDLHTSSPCLASSVYVLLTSQTTADDNVQTIVTRAREKKSNSLDIDFIHDDIHGQSCKKCSSTL